MKYSLFLISLLALSGCDSDKPAYVKYSIDVDDCVVKYVYNPSGSNFFIAKCPQQSVTTTHEDRQGKTSHQRGVITK